MSRVNDEDIETAISDIQLFGSPVTIKLADTFAQNFAIHQRAATKPLLEALRKEIRDELQLMEVPPRDVWLRLDRTVDWSDEAAAVREHLSRVPLSLTQPSTPAGEWELINTEMRRVTDRLTALVGGQPGTRSALDLARDAASQGLVTHETVRAVEGLAVMRDLAEGKPISPDHAREFTSLVGAVLYAIEGGVPTDS